MDPSQFGIIGAAFWIFLACVVVAGIWYAYARKRETQRTIRMAIEKGIQLDDALVDKLVVGESGNPEDYYIGGIVCLACGIGLPVFAQFLARIAPEAVAPVSGAGVLVGLIGIGLMLCGKLIRRQGRILKNGNQGM